jgi:hypothetical protein
MRIGPTENTVPRKTAIIGSGVVGLTAAHGLLQQGHSVDLYSDRTAADWLDKFPPTGTAARFSSSLDLERELGINFWEDRDAQGWGVHVIFCQKGQRQLVDLQGRFERYFTAIDVRAQSARWLDLFEERGGNLEISAVDIPRLEEIAAEHDLTLVATGRTELSSLFERDERRWVHQRPARFLAMLMLKDMAIDRVDEGIPQNRCVMFNLFGERGECFAGPFWHKDGYPCWSVIFEAREGTPLDQFRDCRTGQETLDVAKRVVREHIPWDWNWFKDATLTDDNGWLVGSFIPGPRHVVGTLPSGRQVMALGDTAHSVDPIGGQGANNGYRQVMDLLECVADRGDQAFDECWMRATFDQYWNRVGRASNEFNDLLLAELTKPGIKLLTAQYGSTGREDDDSVNQRIANLFCENFDDPTTLTPAFTNMELAKKVIRDAGGGVLNSGLIQTMNIAKGQLRQAVGLPRSSHPLASSKRVG